MYQHISRLKVDWAQRGRYFCQSLRRHEALLRGGARRHRQRLRFVHREAPDIRIRITSLERGRSLTHELYNDAITFFGAAILQIARKTLDELNAQAAGLDLLQGLVDPLRRRLCDVEGASIVFDGHGYSVRKSVDGD